MKKHDDNNVSSRAILQKHRTKWRISLDEALCCIFVVVGSLCYFAWREAYATEIPFSLNVSETVLEISLPSSVSLDLTPNLANNHIAFNAASLNIGVGTNNPSGYTLSMTAASDTLTKTGIVNGPVIAPLLTTGSATGYTAEQFASTATNEYTLNRWGYKLATASNYMPLSTAVELSSTEAPSNASASDVVVNFAAKVDSSQPAGTYATTLSFNVVANIINTPNCDVDLTGCTYRFNEEVYTESGEWSASIAFISANAEFQRIYTIRWYDAYQQLTRGAGPDEPITPPPPMGENRMAYIGVQGEVNVCTGDPVSGYTSNWTDSAYRTITITGGTDATNPDVITWLQANATLVE